MKLHDPSIASRPPADAGAEPDPTGSRGEARGLALAFDGAQRAASHAKGAGMNASHGPVADRSMPRGPARPHLDTVCPAMLSAKSWAFLGRHVERAFMRPNTWRPTLRTAVRRVALEMETFGAEPASVRRALERSVSEHPACARYDRVLLVTRTRYSHQVIAAMHAWAEAER